MKSKTVRQSSFDESNLEMPTFLLFLLRKQPLLELKLPMAPKWILEIDVQNVLKNNYAIPCTYSLVSIKCTWVAQFERNYDDKIRP